MRLATDDRQEQEAARSAPRNARLGGTDIFRGALVIVTAVVIGGFVISRGLDRDDTVESTTSATTSVDPATAGVEDTTSAGVTTPTTLIDDSALTPAEGSTDPMEDSAGTETTEQGEDAGPEETTPPAARPPAEVKVLVLNGAQTQGIAARGTEALQAASYLTAAPKNATTQRPSAVYYLDDYQLDAEAVAAVFGTGLETLVQPLDPADPPIDDLHDAKVIVVIGTDDLIPIP